MFLHVTQRVTYKTNLQFYLIQILFLFFSFDIIFYL